MLRKTRFRDVVLKYLKHVIRTGVGIKEHSEVVPYQLLCDVGRLVEG